MNIFLIADTPFNDDRFGVVDESHGWFPTRESAQQRVDELNKPVRDAYDAYAHKEQANHRKDVANYRRQLTQYNKQVSACQSAGVTPPRTKPQEPQETPIMTFEQWGRRWDRSQYEVCEVEPGAIGK